MSSEKLKLAFIGCGGIAEAHWWGVEREAGHVEVTAVVDTDAGRAADMAAKTGARPFTSLTEALDVGDFTAVDIMLPHDQHEPAALECFAAGRHVALEKPMSTTVDSCDRVLAAAEAAGTVFMVLEQAQYWADAVLVRDQIGAGAVGEVLTARADCCGAARAGRSGPRPWRHILAIAGGGICIDGGAHWIRPLRMWLGEVEAVVAVTGRPHEEMEGESLARALLRFDSGAVASFDALHAGDHHGPGDEFRVTGTRGELVIEKGGHGRVLRYDRDHPEGEVLLTGKAEGRRAAFGHELEDFALRVLTGSPLRAGPEYSLGELRTALAIYRSAESRQWEPVWD